MTPKAIPGFIICIVLLILGVAVGTWLGPGSARPEAGVIGIPAPSRSFLIAGNTGDKSMFPQLVREAMTRYCTDCVTVLLGDLLSPGVVRDDQEPVFAKQIGAFQRPILAILGDEDHDSIQQHRRGSSILDWAAGQSDIHLPAPTWSATTENALWLGLDSEELSRGGTAREVQIEWALSQLRASSSPLRVAAVHDPATAEFLCGKVDIIVHARPERSISHHCNVVWVGSGMANATDLPQPEAIGTSYFTDQEPGFVALTQTDTGSELAMVTARGETTFSLLLDRAGTGRLSEGSVLFRRD